MRIKAFKRAFYFFVFSSIYIALCAVGMVYQTAHLFGLHHLFNFQVFVFFGTLCSYNFHWYLTPEFIEGQTSLKTRWSQFHRKLHLIAAIVSFIIALVFFYFLRQHFLWLSLTGIFTFLYSAPKLPYKQTSWLKNIAYGKTIFLALAWTHITTMLPLLITNTTWHTEQIVFSLNRFFLIYAICILFDLRDREHDKEEGIKSLITYFDPATIDKLYWSVLVCFFSTTLWLAFYFSVGITISLIIPGLLLLFFYQWFKQNKSDLVYYLLLDGLMVFSLPLLLLFEF